MKKTGKVLSLVLSLALVASSLTATFASAASSKSGTVSLNDDTYYLSNGGSGDELKASILDQIDNVEKITLSDNSVITGDFDAIDAVVSSGSSVATLSTHKTDGVLDKADMKLTSSSASGTVVISARYKTTVQVGDDDDDTTVYGTATITYNVLKDGTVFVLKNPATGETVGENGLVAAYTGSKPDDIDALAKNVGETTTGAVYKVSHGVGTPDGNGKYVGALATWTVQTLQKDTAATEGTPADKSGFAVTSSATGIGVTYTAGASSFTLTTAKVGNGSADSGSYYAPNKNYTITAQNYDEDGDKVSTNYQNKGSSTVTIENRVKAYTNNDTISSYKGVTYLYTDPITSSDDLTAAKAATDAAPESGSAHGLQVVTGCDVDAGATLTIDGGSIGTVASVGTLTVDGGTVAESDAVTTTVNKGTVNAVDGTTLNVYGGTVGTVSATTVNVDTNNELTATVGDITLDDNADAKVNVTSQESYAAKVGTIKASADGAVITLSGDAVTAGQIDAQYYDTDLILNDFKGTIAAPKNVSTVGINSTAKKLSLTVEETDTNNTNAVVTGDAVIPSLTITEGTISFPGSLKVGEDGVSGDGNLVIVPGKFYTDGAISSISLKLLGNAKVGDTVFTAASDAVDTDAFTPYGYTLKAASGTKTDTFTVDTLVFAGLTISGPKTITQNTTATYTASAYPDGTPLPEGYSVQWYFDGDSDSFTTTATGNTLAVKVGDYDETFASINKGTLTAKVLDENGDVDEDYDAATYDISIVKAPNFVSDTHGTYNMLIGQSYTFKITASDGSVPPFVVASNGATVAPYTKAGNDYFFKVTGAKVGDYGVYVGDRVCILHITDVKTDTTKVTVANGKSYVFKITKGENAPAPYFVVAGQGVVLPVDIRGNDYFYKVTNNGKTGDVGVYVNGPKIAVITFTK